MRVLQLCLILLGIIFLTDQVLAEGIDSFDAFAKAFQANQIRSVEDALSSLNRNMFRYPVLVPVSGGNHQTSAKNPRVILNSTDGLFSAAYTTLSTAKDFKLMQFAQTNPVTGEPDFYEIDFANRKANLIKNPPQCMGCHTNVYGRRHLRMEEYDKWAGWFGNNNDPEVRKNQFAPWLDLEKQRIVEFLKAQRENPRLALFDWNTVQDVSWATHVGATRMNVISMHYQARAIYNSLRHMPDFNEFKYALAAYNRYQLSDKLFEEYGKDEQKVEKKLKKGQEHASDYMRALFAKTDGAHYEFMSTEFGGLDFKLLEWLLNRHGDTLKKYSTSGNPNFYHVSPGVLIGLSVLDQIRDLTLSEIGKQIGEKAPRYYGASRSYSEFAEFIEGFNFPKLDEVQTRSAILDFIELAKTRNCETALVGAR